MKNSNEKGAELVEAAFVILLFVILMLGIFQFGRAYNIYQNITNAAREGARFAIAPLRGGTTNYPDPNTEVKPLINSFLQSVNLVPSVATVTITTNNNVDPSCPCASSGCACGTGVNISYPFNIFQLGTITISTSATMRQER